MLASLNEDRWQVTWTQWFSSRLKRISPFRQRSYDLHQASSRYCSLSFGLHLSTAPRARTQFEVGPGDLQGRASGLHEKLGKDGDGALFLDRGLDQIEFV
jgi:hypothetical protein